jgi:thymidylate synthase (FAD)
MVVINKKENILGDGTAELSEYDFSRANESHESRVKAVTTVASICYNNPKAIGKDSLYNRLENEAKGLPSSSFEFVPVLLPEPTVVAIRKAVDSTYRTPKVEKYGEWVEDGKYLLTNLRALLADDDAYYKTYGTHVRDTFNTLESELAIIRDNFKVYRFTAPLFVMRQVMRHRVNWQELSRRYVSGKKKGFEYYLSDKVAPDSEMRGFVEQHFDNSTFIYNALIESGCKPQDARAVIPVTSYTEVWGAFLPEQLKNFISLRTETATQRETRSFADTINDWRGDVGVY